MGAALGAALGAAARRLAIFGLLGPPVGLLVGLAVLRINTGPIDDVLEIGLRTILAITYFLGLAPALATSLIDTVLARRATRHRVLWTTAAGAALGFIAIVAAIGHSGPQRLPLLLWAAVGAAPAALCSWLAARFERPAPAAPR